MTQQQFTQLVGDWINYLYSRVQADATGISALQTKVKTMATSQQVTDILAGITAFEAEVQADVSGLLTAATDLKTQLAAALAQIAAGTSLSAEDAAALTAGTADLAQQVTDLHNKVNPTP